MAAAILFAGMLAIMTALMGGQQQVFETQLQLEASLAAEEKMQQLTTANYYGVLGAWETLSVAGTDCQRYTDVVPVTHALPGAVWVGGKDVTVTVYASDSGRTLAELKAFIPEPQP